MTAALYVLVVECCMAAGQSEMRDGESIIINLGEQDKDLILQITHQLFESFKQYSPHWLSTIEAASDQITQSFSTARVSRVMISEDRQVLGWVSAFVDENVWEIHPIVVNPGSRHKGVGRALVEDVERLARDFGAAAVWAGTSDETSSTSFSQFDLYGDLVAAIEAVDAPIDHAVHFWLGVGYSIVGVQPDGEGLGKPSIHFAKRIV